MPLCPYCGVSNEEAAKFCIACGAGLSAAAPEAEAPAPVDYARREYAQPVYCAPPKKSKAKWIVLGVVIGLVLLACAAAAIFFLLRIFAADPNVGLYIGERAEMLGTEMEIDQVFAGGFTVELKPFGICTVTTGDSEGTGKWSVQGNAITIDDGESTITGTVRDGVLILKNVMDIGVDIYLTRGGAALPSASTGASVQADWWDGDWYGWWMMSSCEGDYAEMESQWWDCIATVTMDERGQGHILLWDEELPKSNALAEFDFTATAQNDGETGIGYSGDGYFMNMRLGGGEITLDPDGLPYENLLCLDGWYEDDAGGFYFELYIRPWGQRWDDWVADEDETILPYFYNDFYIPAIEAGQKPPEDITEAWGSEAAEPQEQ